MKINIVVKDKKAKKNSRKLNIVSDEEIEERVKSYGMSVADQRNFERLCFWVRQQMIERN